MMGAVVSFTGMALAGRYLASDYDTFEIMLYRSLTGIFIIALVLSFTGRWKDVSTTHISRHFFRNVAHFSGQNLWFFALTLAPLAQVVALEFTYPLWVALVAPFFLGERFMLVKFSAILLGFMGILLVTRPFTGVIDLGVMVAAAAAIGFAITNIITKTLTTRETLGAILFWLTAMQCVFGLITAGWDFDIAAPSLGFAPYLIAVGIFGLFAHFCLTSALQIAPASTVLPMDFLRLPLIAVIGMQFYNEPIDIYVFFGATLICTGILILLLSDRMHKKRVVAPLEKP